MRCVVLKSPVRGWNTEGDEYARRDFAEPKDWKPGRGGRAFATLRRSWFTEFCVRRSAAVTVGNGKFTRRDSRLGWVNTCRLLSLYAVMFDLRTTDVNGWTMSIDHRKLEWNEGEIPFATVTHKWWIPSIACFVAWSSYRIIYKKFNKILNLKKYIK